MFTHYSSGSSARERLLARLGRSDSKAFDGTKPIAATPNVRPLAKPTAQEMKAPGPPLLAAAPTAASSPPSNVDGVLDADEAKAILDYVDTAYYDWNDALRTAHKESIPEHIQKSIDLVNAGLEKLPSHHGTLFRGSGGDIHDHYNIAVGSPDVKFIIDCKGGGKDLAGHDGGAGEAEVLFPPATKFLITKVVKEKGEYVEKHTVWMEEIVDDEPSEPAAIDGNDSTPASPEVTLPVAVSTPDAVVDVEITTPAPAPVPLVTPTSGDSTLDGGSVWINGRRRSARHQPQLGSVFVNGLRRSARFRP